MRTAIDGAQARIAADNVPWLLATWARYGEDWRFSIAPRGNGTIPTMENGRMLEAVVASAVDRYGRESRRVRAWER